MMVFLLVSPKASIAGDRPKKPYPLVFDKNLEHEPYVFSTVSSTQAANSSLLMSVGGRLEGAGGG